MSDDDAVIVFDKDAKVAIDFDKNADDTDECNIFGITAGRFRTMTRKELHVALGHYGYTSSG